MKQIKTKELVDNPWTWIGSITIFLILFIGTMVIASITQWEAQSKPIPTLMHITFGFMLLFMVMSGFFIIGLVLSVIGRERKNKKIKGRRGV